MEPIFFRKRIKEIDRITVQSGITSRSLIHSASTAFVKWLRKYPNIPNKIVVFCGNGNNGADGYLIAKKLNDYGFDVSVYSCKFSENRSSENQFFLSEILMARDIKHMFLESRSDFSNINESALALDAILGNGIDRPVEGLMKELIEKINANFERIVAIDVPSGLLENHPDNQTAMKCESTLSFEFPKHSFFAAENEKYVGQWDFVSIGLDKEAIASSKTSIYLVEKKDIRLIFKPRKSFSHKGNMGKVVIISSNSSMLGASHFMAAGCIRCGAGITYLYSNRNQEFLNNLPEVIRLTDLDSKFLKQIDVVGIGPGLGESDDGVALVDKVLQLSGKQLILDADALNIIARKNWHNRIPENSIITPHIKEFSRLFKEFRSHSQRVDYQRKMSIELKLYIILKGRYTSISTPTGELYYNRTGNPALAKGGSGDVLTGMLCGFCSQDYSPLEATILSVFIHGFAADLYIAERSEVAMIPSDLLDLIPTAIEQA